MTQLDDYIIKMKKEQVQYALLKQLDLPRPTFHVHSIIPFWTWYTCPVCNKKINDSTLNGHDVIICACGYGHVWGKE